jgi:ATP-binding cassette, subfamily G (WHITE), member 2, SNQ2
MIANQRDLHYNFHSPKEIATYYRGDVQYFPQVDVYFPTLIVRGTIRFAVKTRIPHIRADSQTRDEIIKEITYILITIFGIRHARKTLVGGASIRGMRSGERQFLRPWPVGVISTVGTSEQPPSG